MVSDQFVRVTPRGFLFMSKEFFEAYDLLQVRYPEITDHFFSKYYNLCHSFELALKALLLARDSKIEELRSNKFGHNLENLLDSFIDKYPEEKVTEIDIAVTRLINKHYQAKEFEYHRRGYMQVPEIKQLDGLVNGFILIAEKYTKGT